MPCEDERPDDRDTCTLASPRGGPLIDEAVEVMVLLPAHDGFPAPSSRARRFGDVDRCRDGRVVEFALIFSAAKCVFVVHIVDEYLYRQLYG